MLVFAALLSACDSVDPEGGPTLVVEAFFDEGEPLPRVRVRQTTSLSRWLVDGASTAVTDAEVRLVMNDQEETVYRAAAEPGVYEPAGAAGRLVEQRGAFTLDVRWGEHHATATGTIPRTIRIDSVRVRVAPEPIQAIRLDSLLFDPTRPDSIRFDTLGAGELAYAYPVEVSLWWQVPFEETGADSAYWVRTQLRAPAHITSEEINFFLRPEQIQRERRAAADAPGIRRWTGIYAVPVPARETPFPAHRLRVALLRSGQDYARYAASRDTPQRREPVSNVTGGIGIAAGISLDTLTVEVR